MATRNIHLTGDCRGISEVLARVGDKWTVLVVTHLGEGPMRFNELRRSINGISQRMLTLTRRYLRLEHCHALSVERRGARERASLTRLASVLESTNPSHAADLRAAASVNEVAP